MNKEIEELIAAADKAIKEERFKRVLYRGCCTCSKARARS